MLHIISYYFILICIFYYFVLFRIISYYFVLFHISEFILSYILLLQNQFFIRLRVVSCSFGLFRNISY